MIELTESARSHFRNLIAQQDIPQLGIRLRAVNPGAPKADCELEFCEPADLRGNEHEIECGGFALYVDVGSMPFLEGAHIDFVREETGGQLSIKAPRLRGKPPGDDAAVEERVRHVLDAEINPRLASHGGRVSLREVTADGIVVLQFGGGCHGCGMVEATLRNGVETTLRERVPEVTGVRDATDHDTGTKPYFERKSG